MIPGRAIGGLLLLLATAAQGERIPHPALDGIEPAVVERVRELRSALEEARDADDSVRATRYGELGAMYHSLDLLDAALACYRAAESLDSDDSRWPYLQGVLHTDNGDLEAAEHALRRALSVEPDLSTARARLGQLALDEGQPEEALKHFRRALSKMPDSAAAHAGTGQALLELGRAREAVVHLKKALELEPRANRLNYPLAMAYRELGDEAKMRSHLNRVGAVGVTVDDPIAEYASQRSAGARKPIQRGNKAYRAGAYAEAVRHFARATRAAPDDPTAWTNLGVSQAALGRNDEARRSLERALAESPGYAVAVENLVAILLDDGETGAARTLLDQHVTESTDNRRLLHMRARLRRQSGEPAAAAEDYRRLTDLDPDNATAWKGMIVARIEADDYSRAGQALAMARQALGNLSEFRLKLIDALVASHGRDQARASLARRLALDLYRENPGARRAVRVLRALLLSDSGCADAARWLDERIAEHDTGDSLRRDLHGMRDELRDLPRCSDARGSDAGQ